MEWIPPPMCINEPCANRGNAAKGGRCNSCAAGNPPASAAPSRQEEENMYPPEIQELVTQSAGRRAAALQDIESFPAMHEVTPWLWIGDERAAGVLTPIAIREGATNSEALTNLRARRITVVVCVSGYGVSHRPFETQGIAYANALLSDGSAESKKASETLFPVLLSRALPLIRAARETGNAVLVHCNAGINRSCSTACSILMALEGVSLLQAYSQVVSARAICQPSFSKYLTSSDFTSLSSYLRLQNSLPTSTIDSAKAEIWCSKFPYLPTTAVSSSDTLSSKFSQLEAKTYKNPLLGLALLNANQMGFLVGWDDVHLFDDSKNNCDSARRLLPSPNVHEIDSGLGAVKQEEILHRELLDLLAKPRAGLVCFDWGGTLECQQLSLVGGKATASLLQSLCDNGWLFACVSNDPNDAILDYQKSLLREKAPPFRIFANGERIHQARLAAAVQAADESSLEDVSLLLRRKLSGGAATDESAYSSSAVNSPVTQWAYYYARLLPKSFLAALQVERTDDITADVLKNASFPDDLTEAIDLLKVDVQPFP